VGNFFDDLNPVVFPVDIFWNADSSSKSHRVRNSLPGLTTATPALACSQLVNCNSFLVFRRGNFFKRR
jgi:hypothetical protein